MLEPPRLVHVPPLYSSVAAESPGAAPPKAKAAACVPAPAKACLGVIMLEPPGLHTAPLYSSVAPVRPPAIPPKAKPAV